MNRKERRANQKQNKPTILGISPGIEKIFDDALRYHQVGRLDEAERLYRRALAADSLHADSLHLLGVIAYQRGGHAAALELIRQAIAIDGKVGPYYSNLGLVLQAQGRLDEAIVSYRKAVDLKPDHAEAHYNLGGALQRKGMLDEAVSSYLKALHLKSNYAQAHYNLGLVRQEQGLLEEAITAYRKALAFKPNHPKVRNNLGSVLMKRGRMEEAIACFRHAIALQPDSTEAYNNLGNALQDQGHMGEAVTACYRRALALKPESADTHSNMLFSLYYPSDVPAEKIVAETRLWNEQHGRPQSSAIDHGNVCDPLRRLRIGYVSPDFRKHSVAWFLEPLLRAHDPDAVEVFCYAEVPRPDAVTERLRGLADHWRNTVGLSDDGLAERIRQDGIDILVDLAGHSANNRLPVFARKPAPVQVTWLGYPGTTGLTAIDYRLVDSITDPEDDIKAWASESLVRLPAGFLCYGPPSDETPEPAASPIPGERTIFGSFNNPAKLSSATLDAWAALLLRMPKAQLLLKGLPFADASTRTLFHHRFAERGIAAERVSLLGYLPDTRQHLDLYHQIDIALDPFPYNGTTTTCEVLWMGVPVVTLRGDRHAGRVGASLLTRIGHEDLIANTVEEYVEIAAALAGDSLRLDDLHQSLRPRMAESSLCDAGAFARSIEAAYRDMWNTWCAGRTLQQR